jgi:hypothetical protein
MGYIFSFFFLTFGLAHGGELTQYPGWRVEEIHRALAEGELNSGPQFFSLKPPNGRDAITIERKEAMALRGGSLDPEVVYRKTLGQSSGAENGSESSADGVVLGGAPQFVQAGEGAHLGGTPQFVQAGEDDSSSSRRSWENQAYSSGSQLNAKEMPSVVSVSSDLKGAAASFVPAAVAPKASRSVTSEGKNSVGGTVDGQAMTQRGLSPSPILPTQDSLAPKLNPEGTALTPTPKASSDFIANAPESPKQEFKGLKPTAFNIYNGSMTQFNEEGSEAKKSEQNRSPSSNREGDSDRTKFGELPKYYECQQRRENLGSPNVQRITVSRGCRTLLVQVWGAGGGGSRGGAGAWVSAGGKVDFSKFDLIAVVGSPGSATDGGRSGGSGGLSSASKGYGGGGFSGLFLIEKSKGGNEFSLSRALAIAGGGGGESGSGQSGGGGRSNGSMSGGSLEGVNGGNGLAYPGCPSFGTCSIPDPNQTADGVSVGSITVNWDHESAGGGGGGGGAAPGKGGAGSAAGSLAGGGEGGGSLHRMEHGQVEAASGSKAALEYFQDRGGAGSPGKPGRLILDIY